MTGCLSISPAKTGLLLLNGLLLMTVTLFPFPTALLAEYLRAPAARTPKSPPRFIPAFPLSWPSCFQLLWRHASRNGRLLRPDHDRRKAQRITEQYRFGPLLYTLSFALAFVTVPASVGMNLALAVFFALPEKPPPP